MIKLPDSNFTKTTGFANNGTVIFTFNETCDSEGNGTLTESDREAILTVLAPYLGSPRSIVVEAPATVFTYTDPS